MARAGRNTPRHVASERRDRPTTPDAAPRHRAGASRQVTKVAGPAVLAFSLAGTVLAYQASGDERPDIAAPAPAAISARVDLSERGAQLSRNASRAVNRAAVRPLTTAPRVVLEPTAVGHAFATTPLNLRSGPSPDSALVRTVPFATRLALTGQTDDGWAEVLVRREVPASGKGEERTKARTVTAVRWVNAEYLADRKPEPPEPEPEPEAESEAEAEATTSSSTSSGTTTTTPGGISGAPCPDGSTVESGLTSTSVQLYRAVCAAFPALSSYGGYAPRGEHFDGRAIDFMVTDSGLGQAVADYALANAGALGIRNIIWSQRIWTPEQASAGWRWMEDRGSATANHYDHVHIAVY